MSSMFFVVDLDLFRLLHDSVTLSGNRSPSILVTCPNRRFLSF